MNNSIVSFISTCRNYWKSSTFNRWVDLPSWNKWNDSKNGIKWPEFWVRWKTLVVPTRRWPFLTSPNSLSILSHDCFQLFGISPRSRTDTVFREDGGVGRQTRLFGLGPDADRQGCQLGLLEGTRCGVLAAEHDHSCGGSYDHLNRCWCQPALVRHSDETAASEGAVGLSSWVTVRQNHCLTDCKNLSDVYWLPLSRLQGVCFPISWQFQPYYTWSQFWTIYWYSSQLDSSDKLFIRNWATSWTKITCSAQCKILLMYG